jgi:glucose-6-phosphate isomerase
MLSKSQLWDRLKQTIFYDSETKFGFDTSRVNLPDSWWSSMATPMAGALKSMAELEKGAIANPDEGRMVGHYWLRNPELSPRPEIKSEIESTNKRILDFAARVHSGVVAPSSGGKYQHLLIVGIGGSALGPQFVTKALGSNKDKLSAFFFDNTDPDGMANVLGSIPDLSKTLCVVISKSGGTKETRNGMLVAKEAWVKSGLAYAKNFVAVTGAGSELDKFAVKEGWLERFPMWDWVGGRTSELSAVGLLPAALQGYDINRMLAGARHMDELTRRTELKANPAAQLAGMWQFLGEGKGSKAMVVLPYSDRLELFSKYLQQLLMESLGKEKDLKGATVHQGISVYGNKGSTDQHAYVQQLRDGLKNFFAVFIHVLKDASPNTSQLSSKLAVGELQVEPGVTAGDYLSGFFQGTRGALYESDRQSLTILIEEVSEHSVGMLIALFERAVGLYASLININAYHQPGVEAGKKAAADVLSLQNKLMEYLKTQKNPQTVEEIASAIGATESAETLFFTLRHLAANGRAKVTASGHITSDKYSI